MAQEMDLVREAMKESGFTLDTGDSTPPAATPPAISAPVAEVTPPVLETPPATIPAADKKEIPALDEGKLLNEKFGDKYKSFDEINTRLKEYDDLNIKFADAAKKTADLESKLSQSPFANDYIKGMNDFVKKGGDAKMYEKVAGIDTTKLSEKDALVLKYRFEHNMTKEDAEFKVARKYKLGGEWEPADGGVIDPEVREARIDLKLDGAEAKKYLSQYRTEQLAPPGERQAQQAQAQLESRMKSWEPFTPALLTSIGKIEVPFDDKGNAISFEVPKETIGHLTTHLQRVLEATEFTPDENGRQLMKDVLLREVFFLHNKEMAKLIAGAKDKQWAKDTHHPSSLKEEVPGAPASADRDMELAQFIAKANGLKL